jgi:hypothetical protein
MNKFILKVNEEEANKVDLNIYRFSERLSCEATRVDGKLVYIFVQRKVKLS